jgi:hypothetical protein
MSDRRARSSLLAAVIVEAIAVGGVALGWVQSHAVAVSEKERTSQHLAAVEQQLSDTSGNLERCEAWMNAKLLLAQGPDAPAGGASAPVAPSVPTASAVPGNAAAPADSASANEVAQTDDTKQVEPQQVEPHPYQRGARMREVRGQANVLELSQPGEGSAKPSP